MSAVATKYGHTLRRQSGLDDLDDCRSVGPDASFDLEGVVSPIAPVRAAIAGTAILFAPRPTSDYVHYFEAVTTPKMHA